jgi:hypothetical protein
MDFFHKKSPQLISIHIPKTAGTSFRNILKQVYGEKEVVRFDISMRGVVRLNEHPYEKNDLPKARVLHGHFSYEAIVSKFKLSEEIPLITWVRDPVQRVISNYQYLESRLIDILQEEKHDLHILEKMQRSLIEYARTEINRNRQSKFLKGIRPDQFAFIGITEYFENDLKLMSDKLGWNQIPETLYHNVTDATPHPVSDAERDEIRSLNADDVSLYNQILELRNLRP